MAERVTLCRHCAGKIKQREDGDWVHANFPAVAESHGVVPHTFISSTDHESEMARLREALEKIVDIGERPLSGVEDWPRRILSIAREALRDRVGQGEDG